MGRGRGPVNDVPAGLRAFAKGQRSAMPQAEVLFWSQVRAGRLAGHKFKRQVPIAPYIVDFLCTSARLIVELDGAPHLGTERRGKDLERNTWLRAQGFSVLRFDNDQVLGNCGAVLARVRAAIETGDPSPAPLRGAPSPAEGERGSRPSGSST